MFALVDCNNFYASCERLFRPNLIGKPVVVLSNNDGCVIARSNEAKALGIPMGAVAYQYKSFFKQHNVNVFSSNFPLYGDLSNRVMNIVGRYSPEVEYYSIDESFLKFSGFDYINLKSHCLDMKYKVEKWTGIPISIGIAPTKALTKVANRVAKKFPEKTNGIYIIDTEDKRVKALKWLKISDVWGIGKKHTKRLHRININTAYDFTLLSKNWVRSNLSILGLRLHQDLNGIPTLGLDSIKSKKSIACTRSFQNDLKTFDELRERVSTFAFECSKKLRLQKSVCRYIVVFIATNRHKDLNHQYTQSRVVTLPYASNSIQTINTYALLALKSIYKSGYNFKRAGVIVSDITKSNTVQLSFFNNEDPRFNTISKAVDFCNNHIKSDSVKIGSQDLNRKWKLRQEHLSQRYTTKLEEVLVVKV